MTTRIFEEDEPFHAPAPLAVPSGESRNEVVYLAVGVVVMALIALAFWIAVGDTPEAYW